MMGSISEEELEKAAEGLINENEGDEKSHDNS